MFALANAILFCTFPASLLWVGRARWDTARNNAPAYYASFEVALEPQATVTLDRSVQHQRVGMLMFRLQLSYAGVHFVVVTDIMLI